MVGKPTSIDWMHRAEQIADRDGVAKAFSALTTAAEDGDADAWKAIAHWRLTGARIRRDLRLAKSAYGMAANLGDRDARLAYIALSSNGAGGSGRDWQHALRLLADDPQEMGQIRIIEQMQIDASGDPLILPQATRIADNIAKIDGFLTLDECRYLVSISAPALRPSMVVDPTTGDLVSNPVRRSDAAFFAITEETPALHAINRRIASVVARSPDHGEPGQVLRYRERQEYRPHVDALFPPHDANQRATTFLIYLNDDYTGGQTCFPNLGLSFRGSPGDALFFSNIDNRGGVNRDMVHSGAPVTSGVKFLYSRWIRSHPLDLSGPEGRPF